MILEDQEFHSNCGWLGAIIHSPKNVLKVNNVALDRLLKLGYVEVIGKFVFATTQGKIYIKSVEKPLEEVE